MLKNQLLYFTAPSRSGSSLLETLLNCLKYIVIVNEPLDSYRITDRKTISLVYNKILKDLSKGLVVQRVDKEGNEVTDTFPNKDISWQKKRIDFYPNSVIGIKKSFPSLGNKDWHDVFIKEWPTFVGWFTKEKGGKVLAIIRNPIYTILSWKTTFDDLNSDTKNQCEAWNRIVSTLIKTRDKTYLVKYESLIENISEEIQKIAKFLGVDFEKIKEFPVIRKNHNTLEYYMNNRKLEGAGIGRSIEIIVQECNSVSRELGYDLKEDIKLLSNVR